MNIKKFIATLFGLTTKSELEFIAQQMLKTSQEYQAAIRGSTFNEDFEKVAKDVDTQIEQQAIYSEVDFFIKTKDLAQLNIYLAAGYPLAPEQFKTIYVNQPDWILSPEFAQAIIGPIKPLINNDTGIKSNSAEDITIFKKHLLNNYLPQISNIIVEGLEAFQPPKIIPTEKQFNSEVEVRPSEVRAYVFNSFSKAAVKLQLSIVLIENYKDSMKNNEGVFKAYNAEIKNLKNALELTAETKNMALSRSHEEAMRFGILGVYHGPISRQIAFLDKFVAENFADRTKLELSKKINKIQNLYRSTNNVENMQEDLKHNFSDKITGFQKNSISPGAWSKIEAIQNHSQELKKQIENLGPEDKFEVLNLSDKVLFEVINEYIAFSPKHKAELKNDAGQSIDDLFMENLNNIEAKLSSKLDIIGQAQFKKIKTSNLYLKAGK